MLQQGPHDQLGMTLRVAYRRIILSFAAALDAASALLRSRWIASDRVTSFRTAHRSTALIVSGGSRTPINVSVPAVDLRAFLEVTIFGSGIWKRQQVEAAHPETT
jgi:hypothetical protein